MKDYKVAFLSDSHLYDWDGMFGMSSEERLLFAVDGLLKEHRENGKIDMVFMPGDYCNNRVLESYPAGEFMGESYGAGASGTDIDPEGELRLARFNCIIKPLWDNEIPVFCANGNHDIYSHRVFEKAFGYADMPMYIAGGSHDPSFPKGYGKNYAVRLDDDVAFIVFDVFDGEKDGFVSNASGKNWPERSVDPAVVQELFAATQDFREVFVVSHWMDPALQGHILDEFAARENVKVSFVGHAHAERKRLLPCGKPEYICGYLGVPMYNAQKDFQLAPFSYRILERRGDALSTHIVLLEKDYPAYTFSRSSGASVAAFYQPYVIRGRDRIE